MKKLLLLFCSIVSSTVFFGQNPATTIVIPNRNITLPCGTNCTNISAQVPHIKQTDDYVLTRPAYMPFAYTTATGNELTAIYTDDRFSALINMPFNFCFYGSSYSSVVLGSNNIMTFDATNANTANSWPLTTSGGSGTPVPIPYAGGTQNSSFSTYYPKASIMGPYYDIYPTLTNNGLRKIEWRVEGSTPQRRFIASYNAVPLFSCNTLIHTSQMVVYENTGIVEVYVKDKPTCSTWNQGLSILGIQNFNRDKAVAAQGKNCTNWGGTNIDSCYRFIPSSGASRFLAAELLVNGTVVATAGTNDTSTVSPGTLNINFTNLCPVLDSTAYVLRVTFSPCGTEGNAVFTDTVFVKKSLAPVVTVAKTDANCSTNGTITITATGSGSPFEYSINGGTTWQVSNVFTNVPPGTYNARARSIATQCPSASQQVTIVLVNTLGMTVAKADANCTGGSITITPVGGTAPYQYSINGGTTFQSANTFTGLSAGTYNVQLKDAVNCISNQQVTLTFTNNLTMSANQQANVCFGGSFTPSFTSNATGFSWSPATGVSNPAILNPVLSPQNSTTYTVTATLGTCTTQRTVNLTVFPGVSVNAGPDAILIAGDVYQMQGTGSAGTYLWTPSSGLSAANTLAPTATPAATTTYTLRITTLQGCTGTDDVVLTVIPYCIKPMEAFTPNGDGINDLWLITNGNCLTSAKAQVFNRYGAKVFEDNNYKNTWNGTYKGKPLPDGTYYYIISFQLLNGRVVLLKGNLTILR
jgi:gliding motility-associated-like protein